MVNLNRWSHSIGGHIRKECGGNVREVVTSSPVNLRWKWPNLEQIATEGFFALTG